MSSRLSETSIAVDSSRRVPFLNFPAQWAEEREELLPLLDDVFSRGAFVGGEEIERFESEAATYLGVRCVVALNSGTDALTLALRALGVGPGDEVITAANSFVASAAAIAHVGAVPVFADVLGDQTIDPSCVEAVISNRTRAIMPVHLTGRVADMGALGKIAARHGLALVEDAAQAFGSRDQGRFAGTFGIGAFSAHPLKNLNAAGDAGFITTNDDAIAERVRRLRNHGLHDRDTSVEFAFVSRMDGVQAVVLRFRLQRIGSVLARRAAHAARYDSLLAGVPAFVPTVREGSTHTYHLYVIQVPRRDELQTWLAQRGIETKIHYPTPIHLMPAAEKLGYRRGSLPRTEEQAARILSIPVNQWLTQSDVDYVAETIGAFYR
jgi:dTDP-4-amino-4,6-dideoxygalactose transaminase